MVLKLPRDFAKKIGEVLCVQEQGVAMLFEVEEDKMGYFVARLKPKQFLDKDKFRTMCALARDLGGEGYIEGAKAWKVPGPFAKKFSEVPSGQETNFLASHKAPGSTLPKETSVDKSPNSIDEEIVESLKGSAAKVGHLYPVLVDASGNTIDGFHRRKANPNWPTYQVEFVSDPLQLAKARLIANERRNVPAEEKKALLDEIAKMTGWTPKQIAEDLGWSERKVYRYLSGEYKAPEPEQLVGAREQLASDRLSLSSKSEDIKLLIPCARCGEPIQGAPIHLGEGKYYDAECAEAVVAEAKTGHGPSIAPERGVEEVEKEETSKTSRRETLKAVQIGEFECAECNKRFTVNHMPNGKHKFMPVRGKKA